MWEIKKEAGVSPQTPTSFKDTTSFSLPPLSKEDQDLYTAFLDLRVDLDDNEKLEEFNKNKQQVAKALIYYGAWKLNLREDIDKKLKEYLTKKEKKKEDDLIKKILKLNTYDCAYVDWGTHLVVGEVAQEQDKEWKTKIKFPWKYIVIDKKHKEAVKIVKLKFDNAKDDENKSFL